MALRYVLDENLRGDLWDAIQFHNRHSAALIDVVRVGGPFDLPLASKDPAILVWAENAGRVLVSRDKRTMIADLAAHLQIGRSSRGLFVIRRGAQLADVLAFLICAASAGDDDQWHDQVVYIP
jgi:hypothetical protein